MKRISKAEADALEASIAKLPYFWPCHEISSGLKIFEINNLRCSVGELRIAFDSYNNDDIEVCWVGYKKGQKFQVLSFAEVLEIIDSESFKIELLYHIDILDL